MFGRNQRLIKKRQTHMHTQRHTGIMTTRLNRPLADSVKIEEECLLLNTDALSAWS